MSYSFSLNGYGQTVLMICISNYYNQNVQPYWAESDANFPSVVLALPDQAIGVIGVEFGLLSCLDVSLMGSTTNKIPKKFMVSRIN